jgi:ABC-type transport system involved in multi-copper enzyme maturation permease subunit
MKKTTSIKKNKVHPVSSVGAKPKKKISKAWKIVIIILSIISVGAVVFFCIQAINKNTAQYGQTVNDEHALIIGVEHEHNNFPVLLQLQVNGLDSENNKAMLFDKTLSSYDPLMKTRKNQNENIVFYDFTEEVRNVINDAAITYWLNIDDNYLDNHIVCYVTSLGGQITSAPFEIKGPGIWYLQTAESNGATIGYNWTNVVIQYVWTWSKVRISYE